MPAVDTEPSNKIKVICFANGLSVYGRYDK